MRRRSRRLRRTLTLGAIVGVVLLIGLLLVPANVTKNFEQRQVLIPRGASIEAIADSLHQEGLIGNKKLFVLSARIMGYDRNLKAGQFTIPVGSSTYRILRQLAKGMSAGDMVTIPEGLRVDQIAEILHKGAKIDPVRFMALANDSAFMHSIGVPADRVEGYLYPDTYPFYPLLTPQEVMRVMVERSLKVFGEEMALPDAKMGLTLHQLVTLASVVEAEAQVPSERPRIAAVFYNRLNQGMMLQSDPTVLYALGEWRGRVFYKDLDVKSPYNTYRNRGLPPGPICNPGRGAVHAVLFPNADSTELYFVARGDGTHIFTKSWEDHLRAIAMVRAQARRESTLVPRSTGLVEEAPPPALTPAPDGKTSFPVAAKSAQQAPKATPAPAEPKATTSHRSRTSTSSKKAPAGKAAFSLKTSVRDSTR
jgi:UPF0755 protein